MRMRRWKEFCVAVKRLLEKFLYFFVYFFKMEERKMLKDKWVDKVDGVDINSANDINQVAQAVIELENAVDDIEADYITEAELNSAVASAIEEAKQSGSLKGEDGKSAYEYAVDGGYIGSETKFSEQLAGIPDWEKVESYTANATIVIPQQSVSSGMWMNRKYDIEPGIPYAVYIGGKEYFCIAGNEDGTIYLGNPKLFDSASTQAHNNEPFCITWAGGAATAGMFFKDSTLSYPITLKVTGAAVITENKLPEEYLPANAVKSVNGVLPDEAGNVEVEGGGGADIDVVAEVGQTIIVKAVDENGKPTEWESAEYQPRTHGKGIVELYNATLTGLTESNVLIKGFSMQAGETYYITWNGVEYTCVCVEVPDTGGMCYIGNGSLVELEDTGEPFLIAKATEDGVNFFTVVISADGVDETTVVIKGTGYIPIPAQYLTNAFPYYLDYTAEIVNTQIVYHCDETLSNITSVINSGRLILARETNEYGFLFCSLVGCFVLPTDGSLVLAFCSVAMIGDPSPNRVFMRFYQDGTTKFATEYDDILA